jgi:hypothetical protein
MLGDKGNGAGIGAVWNAGIREWRAGIGAVWNAGDDKGNGVAGNMMSINNISILVVGILGTTRMLMLVIAKGLGATGWSLCPRTKPGLWPTP